MPPPSPTAPPVLLTSQPFPMLPSTRTPTLTAATSRGPSRLSRPPTERVCYSRLHSRTCPPLVVPSVSTKITTSVHINGITRPNESKSLPPSRSARPRERKLHCHPGSSRSLPARRGSSLRPHHPRDLPGGRSLRKARQGRTHRRRHLQGHLPRELCLDRGRHWRLLWQP